MEASLSSLISAAQNGDLDAFTGIIKRFQGMAYASAYAMLEDSYLAEDVAQEAFIEAYLNLPKLREPDAFPGWFRRILFKQGDRVLRGKHLVTVSLEPTTTFDISIDTLNPVNVIEDREMQGFVRHAIAMLPEHERIVILLFYGNDYSLKDIAAFLEVPLSTVKKRLHDARKRLKTTLMDEMRGSLHKQQSGENLFSDKIRLLIAVRIGDIDKVKAQVEHDPTLVNTKMEWNEATVRFVPQIGYTALHEAAANGHAPLVDLLIEYGALVNIRTRSGTAPLHSAILANQRDVVQLLLARGADANMQLVNGLTPLHLAAMKGHKDIAELLLVHNAMLNAKSASNRTPLHWAALKGHADIVQLFMLKDADIHIRDELGRTPLDWALARNQSSVVQLLRHFSEFDCQNSSLAMRKEP